MAEIALMICAVSSLSASVGGGFYLFKKEQENTAKEELIAEKKASPYVTMFLECDYKEEFGKVGEGDDFVEAELEFGSGIKSIIVPAGFQAVDTYSEERSRWCKNNPRWSFRPEVYQLSNQWLLQKSNLNFSNFLKN
jgi:hypothetical protein